jgi:hypothetical protein
MMGILVALYFVCFLISVVGAIANFGESDSAFQGWFGAVTGWFSATCLLFHVWMGQ